MGTHLFFSNRIELLAGKLAELLRAEQAAVGDPFADSLVIVPNPNLAKWLQMEIARRNGACVNVQFRFLEQGLWQSLSALDPRPVDSRPAMLGRDQLQWAVLAVLLAKSDDPTLAPLVRYCRGDDVRTTIDTANPDSARRLWQLSGRMTGYFREYEYHRGDMVTAWLRGEASPGSMPRAAELLASDAPAANMVRCQQALYVAVFGPDGMLPAADAPALSLSQYADALLGHDGIAPGRADGAGHIHVFGLSQISRFHSQLLYELGSRSRLNLYHLNVCTEFWEDITTDREDRWLAVHGSRSNVGTMQTDDGEDLDLAIENVLLRAWGKAGRETIKLLSDLEEASAAEGNFASEWLVRDDSFDGPDQTVLRTLQNQIAHRTGSTAVRIPQDRSLQIAACPSVYREVETVHNSILHNMTDPVTGSVAGLRLSDIAVLVPDMETYRPAIAAVFDGLGQVPYSLVDSNASVDSVFGQALLLMVDLAGSAFTRKRVFELVMNPCFLAGAGVTRDDAAQWLQWADRLSVFHSIDPEHRGEQGLPESAHYTWQQALRRLRLGRVMDETASAPFDDLVPYSDMETGDARQVSAFSDVLERLFSRLRGLASRRMTCTEWSNTVAALAEEFLGIPADRQAEAYVERRVLDALQVWSGRSATLSPGTFLAEAGDNRIGLPLIAQLLSSTLAAIPSGRGSYLSGGVTIASLLPMRPIPFKVVYVLGLGEGRFPGAAEESALDLRSGRRRIGDVSLPDANRYLFLETLVSVREKLYLSYVGRDLQKDEEFYPCSVIKQLQSYVSEHILPNRGDECEPFQTVDVPLSGTSTRYLAPNMPDYTDLLVDFSLANRLACLVRAAAPPRHEQDHASGQRVAAPLEEPVLRNRPTPKRMRELLSCRLVDEDANGLARRAALIRAALAEFAGLPRNSACADPAEGVMPVESPTEVTIRELSRFIENPVEQSVRRHLRLFADDVDESALAEDEPFVSQRLDAYGLVVETFDTVVRQWDSNEGGASMDECVAFLRERYRREQRSSRAPEEAFGELDIDALIASTISRIEGTEKKPGLRGFLAVQGPPTVCDVVLGDTARRDIEPGARLAPAVLEVEIRGQAINVEITGDLPFLWTHADWGAQTLVLTDSSSKNVPERRLIQSFLFYLAVLASDQTGNGREIRDSVAKGTFTARVACRNGDEFVTVCRQWSVHPAMARAYLSRLLGEYLAGVSSDLLPFALIVGNRDLPKPYDPTDVVHSDDERCAYVEALTEAIEADAGGIQPTFRRGPLMDILDDCASVPEDAYDKVTRRLELMLGPGTKPEGAGSR